MNTCRVCKGTDSEYTPFVKYGVRHYAHPECAMKKWGVAFLSRLTDWQCTRFPYFVAKEYGALDELERRCDQYEASERKSA